MTGVTYSVPRPVVSAAMILVLDATILIIDYAIASRTTCNFIGALWSMNCESLSDIGDFVL